MKPKLDEIITTAAFCGFLAVMSLVYIFAPKSDFSDLEKRYLANAPELSWENIVSGNFGDEAETYMADHIPGRDFFVGLNAYVNLFTGRQINSDIYVTTDGRLVEAPVQWDEAAVEKNMNAINSFAEKVSVPVDLLIVPSAGWASRQDVAGPANDYQDDIFIQDIYSRAGENLRAVDVISAFDNNDLYYKTDHHWTSEGAYTAYRTYMEHLVRGYKPAQAYTVETVSGFHGSTYSRAALWLTEAEDLELWKGSGNITVWNGESETEHAGVFYTERLQEQDKYTVYLDGNHSLVRITNPDAPEGGKLLVIRDSYSNCLGGFLAESYSEVVLIDLRYYKKSISELVETEGFDNILVCYSLGNFLTDTNIIWLR